MSDRWFEAFRQEPQAAVSDLFCGRAGAGTSLRLDVPEFLRQRFSPDLVRDLRKERKQLDEALLGWLVEMRRDCASLASRLGWAVYGKRIGDALVALQLLDLPETRRVVSRDLDAWLRWLTPLRLAPERDPGLECLRLVTRGQLGNRHAATWLRLAADRRAEYLSVALAGLQLLPNSGNARTNQALMLHALLRHATTAFHEVHGARRFFVRRFRAIRALYPRGPEHWNRLLSEAMGSFLNQAGGRLAQDLCRDLQEGGLAGPPRSHLPRKTAASEQEWRSLQTDIRSLASEPRQLAHRLFAILDRNHDYALATGNSYPFVRCASNLGSELLVHHTLDAPELGRLLALIEQALVWEPANPYCWSLWAKWFQVKGQREAQEAVLREMLRMFPRNAVARVELARLLIGSNRGWQEAELHLRRVLEQDPNSVHAVVVLARLLASRGRSDEARALLAGLQNSDNRHARDFLARLEAGLPVSPPGPSPQEPQDGPEQASSGYDPVPSGTLPEVLRRGGLAVEFNRALAASEGTVQTTQIEQQSLAGDALAGFYSQWLKLQSTPAPPPHAWAWRACLHWQRSEPPDAWQRLAERFPEAVRETDFLRRLRRLDSHGHAPDHEGWQSRYRSGGQGRPVDALMREMTETWEELVADNGRKRNEAACALMACGAVNAPEFAANVG